MRIHALVLAAVVALAAACGPTTPPVSTTTTTPATQMLREAYIPLDDTGTVRIDSSRYPAGATIEVSIAVTPTTPTGNYCMGVVLVGTSDTIPGSLGCEEQPGGQAFPLVTVFSQPVPLVPGDVAYFAGAFCGVERQPCGFSGDRVRIRW